MITTDLIAEVTLIDDINIHSLSSFSKYEVQIYLTQYHEDHYHEEYHDNYRENDEFRDERDDYNDDIDRIEEKNIDLSFNSDKFCYDCKKLKHLKNEYTMRYFYYRHHFHFRNNCYKLK